MSEEKPKEEKKDGGKPPYRGKPQSDGGKPPYKGKPQSGGGRPQRGPPLSPAQQRRRAAEERLSLIHI